MSVVVSEKNAALSAADTQMEVLRKIAEEIPPKYGKCRFDST